MADNTTLNPGAEGNVVRDLQEVTTGIHYPVCVQVDVTTLSDGANVLNIPVAATLADALANPVSTLRGTCLYVYNGSTWDRVRGDTTNGLKVNVTRVPAITPDASPLQEEIIDINSSGDNLIVGFGGGFKVYAYRLVLNFADDVDIYVRDGVGGDPLTGPMRMYAGGSWVLDYDGVPWFTTSENAEFVLNLSAAVQVSGRLYYKAG